MVRDKTKGWVEANSIPEVIGITFLGWEEGG
jgi:hypothetical protein